MTTEVSLLRSIWEAPDDLDLRRVFADWLQDQEEPALAERGELVRLQCELMAWVPEWQRREELRQREQALLPAVRQEWVGPWQQWGAETAIVTGLPRVSLEAHRFLARSFVEQAASLCRHSWVEMVRLEELRLIHVNRLARCPALAELPGLDLSGNNLEDEHLHRLLRLARLEGLRQLDLSNNQLSNDSARLLVDSGLLERLVRLDLRNNRLTATGICRLLQGAGRQLKCLEVSGNHWNARSLQLLGDWREAVVRRRLLAGRPARLLNSVGMELVLIPAGEFLMGSPDSEPERDATEGPRHEVRIRRPFYLGACHVTQEQYARVMGRNPSHFRAGGAGGAEVQGQDTRWFPVEMVAIEQAREFCRLLSELPEERQRGRQYRLPTEAEWEYACRADGLADWPFSSGWALGPRQATCNSDYSHPSGDLGSLSGGSRGPIGHSTPGGSFPANAFGLYDMHGNCWDWCGDRFAPDYYQHSPCEDPPGPDEGTGFVIRGGSWFNGARFCRSAERYGTSAAGSFCISFRVVLPVGPGGIG